MLLVKRYLREAYKLKKFLTQIKIKITNKGPGLPTVIKQVAYIGLFLLERVLEWFEPYFTNYLLLLAILVLLYVFNSPKVITVAASA